MTAARLVASLGGAGLLRPAPGTWGSLVVLPAALLGPGFCTALALALTLAGFWAVPRVTAADRLRASPEGADPRPKHPSEDPGWVVVDEGAGQALALAALPAGAGWPGVLLAFLLFRAFDILKPGPVGWADRQPGARGVMLDDLIAGAMAAALILVARALEVPL